MILRLSKNQRGFTILETLVAAAIATVLIGSFTMVTVSVFLHSGRSNAHLSAANDNENAARLISQDGQMAQNTDLIPGAEPVNSIILTWTDPINGDYHEVDYFLSSNNLQRKELINSVLQSEKTLIKTVSNIEFYQSLTHQQMFSFTLTLSRGNPPVVETREYDVTLRAMD